MNLRFLVPALVCSLVAVGAELLEDAFRTPPDGTKLAADGILAWDVPPGNWTILRLRSTWSTTSSMPLPSRRT